MTGISGAAIGAGTGAPLVLEGHKGTIIFTGATAALRKRFERAKARLRKLAEAEGLLGD